MPIRDTPSTPLADPAEERARLLSRRLPFWYGPSAAVSLAAFGVGMSALHLGGRTSAWAWAAPAGLALALGLVLVRRRVLGPRNRTPERRRSVALAAVAAFFGTAAVCTALGLGTDATIAAGATVLGLGAWAHAVRRNMLITRQLRALD
ncbi:hypothetical protein [Streptomyces sp. NPDC048172]|uniref:hypothetical protein n=1 Tax=Streptomyces sp. NPDC048172 TaxID=3365505 RepID=UPI0037202185